MNRIQLMRTMKSARMYYETDMHFYASLQMLWAFYHFLLLFMTDHTLYVNYAIYDY